MRRVHDLGVSGVVRVPAASGSPCDGAEAGEAGSVRAPAQEVLEGVVAGSGDRSLIEVAKMPEPVPLPPPQTRGAEIEKASNLGDVGAFPLALGQRQGERVSLTLEVRRQVSGLGAGLGLGLGFFHGRAAGHDRFSPLGQYSAHADQRYQHHQSRQRRDGRAAPCPLHGLLEAAGGPRRIGRVSSQARRSSATAWALA